MAEDRTQAGALSMENHHFLIISLDVLARQGVISDVQRLPVNVNLHLWFTLLGLSNRCPVVAVLALQVVCFTCERFGLSTVDANRFILGSVIQNFNGIVAVKLLHIDFSFQLYRQFEVLKRRATGKRCTTQKHHPKHCALMVSTSV